jgi:hypothetical protein
MSLNKDVTLAETWLAGTSHIYNFDAVKPSLTPGTRLVLIRELANDFDGWAIRVETEDGKKGGICAENGKRSACASDGCRISALRGDNRLFLRKELGKDTV